MIVLGIETSCDETGIGLINSHGEVLSNVLYSQIKTHAQFGGVVPEIAAREHLKIINSLIQQALNQAGLNLSNISGIAATVGPGLVGALLVGSLTAKTLAVVLNKPFLAINHLQAHALMPMLEHKNIKFPFLLLLISGGHTQFVAVEGVDSYVLLGSTIDDAVGEAFDKSARLLGFAYPGGKVIEERAQLGNNIYKLPLPLVGSKGCNFSFSGLKTAVKQLIEKTTLTSQNINDICCSLQTTITTILIKKSNNAIDMFYKKYNSNPQLVISGGVSANKFINSSMVSHMQNKNIEVFYPSLHYATDNGTMIAWAGLLKLKLHQSSKLDFPILPRYPLESIL